MKAVSRFFFGLLARRFPALWELVGGPPVLTSQDGVGAQDPAAAVALNPSPSRRRPRPADASRCVAPSPASTTRPVP